jgi:hypothetical protein
MSAAWPVLRQPVYLLTHLTLAERSQLQAAQAEHLLQQELAAQAVTMPMAALPA